MSNTFDLCKTHRKKSRTSEFFFLSKYLNRLSKRCFFHKWPINCGSFHSNVYLICSFKRILSQHLKLKFKWVIYMHIRFRISRIYSTNVLSISNESDVYQSINLKKKKNKNKFNQLFIESHIYFNIFHIFQYLGFYTQFNNT